MKFSDSAKFENVAFIKEGDAIKRVVTTECNDTTTYATINELIEWAKTVKLYERRERTISEKTLEKRNAQDAIRTEYENKFTEICLENALQVKENENVPHVLKVYDENGKYVLYIRTGRKTAQILVAVENIPSDIKYTTMKYSLPGSVIVEYNEGFEKTINAIIGNILQ